MQAITFWKTVIMDESNLLEKLISLLQEQEIRFCVIGGASRQCIEPLVSLDLGLAMTLDQLKEVQALLESKFEVERFPHSLNVGMPGSALRVQIQTDERYAAFFRTGRNACSVGHAPVGR